MAYAIARSRRFRSDGVLTPVRRTVALVDIRTPAQQLVRDTKQANRMLAALGTRFHDGVPLDTVNDILAAAGFDELEGMLLCGREGRLHEAVGRNRWLALTWYRMESGRYEVIAYVS
jgi:hypothetical protein